MPMRLNEGWNQIQFNMSAYTPRETLRMLIHANYTHYALQQSKLDSERPPPLPKQDW